MSPRSTTSAMFRKSSLLATALGFAAIGSVMMPAAVMAHSGGFSAHEPSFSSAPTSSSHSIGGLAAVQPHAVEPSAAGSGRTVGSILRQPLHTIQPTVSGAGHSISGTLRQPLHTIEPAASVDGKKISGILQLPAHAIDPVAPGASLKVGGMMQQPPHVIGPPAPGASEKIGGIMQQPPHAIDPPAPVLTGGVDNICPFNKFKCPPSNQPGTGGGTPPAGPQNPGPGGQGYPSGDTGPVVISVPPVDVQVPGTVITGANPVATTTTTTTSPARTPAAATEPCNCLTKQYLDDGSVLFRDLCTKEAAIATPAELKAQASAAR